MLAHVQLAFLVGTRYDEVFDSLSIELPYVTTLFLRMARGATTLPGALGWLGAIVLAFELARRARATERSKILLAVIALAAWWAYVSHMVFTPLLAIQRSLERGP